MKNIVLSAVAVLAMSSFAVAGGDIAPVEEPIVVVEEPVVSDEGFYLGLAYGWQNADVEYGRISTDEDFGSIMIDAGYKFNPYIAIEGRYWWGLSQDTWLGYGNILDADTSLDSWALFVKPMYPVTDQLDIYALLGYGQTDVTSDNGDFDVDGFAWGIGMEYGFTDNVSMFIDYTQPVNDETIENILGNDLDLTVSTINIGVNYKF